VAGVAGVAGVEPAPDRPSAHSMAPLLDEEWFAMSLHFERRFSTSVVRDGGDDDSGGSGREDGVGMGTWEKEYK
jgi:hypothetical protein